VSYFTAVRIFSLFELCLFAALVAFAIGGWSESAATALGWSHGIGWILLCLLVANGAMRGDFTWTVLAATVSPAGPVGSTAGIEWLARRRRRADTPAAGSAARASTDGPGAG
jgi:uncharacterized membrane protein